MTIRTIYYVSCTQCTSASGPGADSEEDARQEASESGWKVGFVVPNGSLWDFCPRCWEKRKNLKE